MMINLFQHGSREIVVVSRDQDKQRTTTLVCDFFPYMYVEDPSGKFVGLKGEHLKRVVFTDVLKVKEEREKYPKTWESDIKYTDRFLIDRYPELPNVPIRKMFFDIETTGQSQIDVLNTPDSITCICIHDSFLNKKAVFVWHPLLAHGKDELAIKPREDTVIYKFGDEKGMLEHFINFVISIDPDLLVGWNVCGFDIPYLYNRCKKLGLDFAKASYNGKMGFDTFTPFYGIEETEVDIPGRYVFDLLRAYRYMNFSEMESYKLGAVAKKELNDDKLVVEDGDFYNVWTTKTDDLIEYCIKDVELTRLLDEKLELVETFNERRLFIGCQWRTLWQPIMFQDMLFLREARRQGIVLPRKQKSDKEFKIKGGFVREVIPGLHYGIITLDLKSLYPSIMRTFNMSPETVTELSGGITIPELNLSFSKDKVGFLSGIIGRLWALRDVYKTQLKHAKEQKDEIKIKTYDRKQYAIKVIANSIFGVFDHPAFRLHDKRISNAITFLGRKIISHAAETVEKAGYKVIYADTDSCFVELGKDKTPRQLGEAGEELAKLINDSFNDFTKQFNLDTHYLQMCFEKGFSVLFFGTKDSGEGAKKRYAGYKVVEG